jgi:hypothetical protein
MNKGTAKKVLHLLAEASKGTDDKHANPYLAKIAEYGDDAIPVLTARLDTLLDPSYHDPHR